MAVIDWTETKAALVVAHPAHELRLLGWLEQSRPDVYALTDGRGRRNVPRIERTGRIIRDLRCQPGEVFGDMTDASIYESLLAGQHRVLLRVLDQLADAFTRQRYDVIVVDAHEDAFLSHDVLNALVRGAVLAAEHRLGRELLCYDYALEHDPRSCPEALVGDSCWLRLDNEQLHRKLKIAGQYEEVSAEVSEAIGSYGAQAFAVECLRPLRDLGMIRTPSQKPIYETHGEQMVREGNYREVVRFDQHVAPLFERLRNYSPLECESSRAA